MITGTLIGLGAAVFADGLIGAAKSTAMDEKSLKKYAQAFEKNEKAKMMVEEKAQFLDKRLQNVAKKKQAIIKNSIPRFVEVYGQIQKLEIEINNQKSDLLINLPEEMKLAASNLTIVYQKPMSTQEMVVNFIRPFTGGLRGMMVADSEHFASAARGQLSQANVNYSQAESICALYDAIIERADRLSNLLAAFNFLFLRVIQTSEKVIEKNGINVRLYTKEDKSVLMTCVNFAAAIADIMKVPVLSEEGQLLDAGLEAIQCGEKYLEKMRNVINELD